VRMSGGQPSYSHVVTVSGTGKIVYIAASSPVTSRVIARQKRLRARMEQTFKNLDRCSMRRWTWADVVKDQYLRTRFRRIPEVWDVRMRYFGVPPHQHDRRRHRVAGPDFMIESKPSAVVNS